MFFLGSKEPGQSRYVWNVWVKSLAIPIAIVSTLAQGLASGIRHVITLDTVQRMVVGVLVAIPVGYLAGRIVWYLKLDGKDRE